MEITDETTEPESVSEVTEIPETEEQTTTETTTETTTTTTTKKQPLPSATPMAAARVAESAETRFKMPLQVQTRRKQLPQKEPQLKEPQPKELRKQQPIRITQRIFMILRIFTMNTTTISSTITMPRTIGTIIRNNRQQG